MPDKELFRLMKSFHDYLNKALAGFIFCVMRDKKEQQLIGEYSTAWEPGTEMAPGFLVSSRKVTKL